MPAHNLQIEFFYHFYQYTIMPDNRSRSKPHHPMTFYFHSPKLLPRFHQNHNRLLDTQEAILSTITLQLKYGALSLRNALHRNIITFKAENGLPQGYMGSFHYCSQYDTALDQKIVMNMMGNSRVERRSCLIP